ncbi:MAG: hypothetical protein OFPI_04700 [Osedax symbiont Rs2]|nr:MAG: hypothetical protein OFPII_20020 [Osedax symbiont Rs1]EPJ55052.1 MAG: hypothetical protein OFPI_04700 [Osedax symbiont Rs2]
MPIVFFSDIDDTLIQTQKKCLNEPELTTSAVDANGNPSSYSTPAQQLLINMCKEHIFIPVTGRNKAALDRVSINTNTFQVIDHGAIVLNESGDIDTEWATMLTKQSTDWQNILEDYLQQVQYIVAKKSLALRCRIIFDFGFACYISIKGDPRDLTELAAICQKFSALADNARVHTNGNNMALLPPFACKKLAVNYLKQHYLKLNSATLFIGLGDSNSDLPFMQACHFQMIPPKSQISADKLA